jgi:hypothetical protein
MSRHHRGTDGAHEAGTSTTGPHAPLAQALRVDRACAAFEAAWRQDQAPRIETSLEECAASDPDRSLLLRELLALELELRQCEDGSPAIADYLARFPDHAAIVARAFREVSGLAETGIHAPRTGEVTASPVRSHRPRRFGDYTPHGRH